jgi:hypothetical protein
MTSNNAFILCTLKRILKLVIQQQMHYLLHLERFNFTQEITYRSLLHVSVFDHPQGACMEPG